MTLARRLSEVEEKHLSPKEAVILWMREAHQFGSLASYGCWLADQPLDAYPLMRIPRQVVAAVKAQNKAVPRAQLHQKIYRAQKDALFLFHLHSQLNQRATQAEEARHLRLALLQERLLTLVYWTYSLDHDRLDSFTLPDGWTKPPTNDRMAAEKLALEAHVTSWPQEEALLWGEVSALLQAERLLAERYFAGEPLLFPDTVDELTETLCSLDRLFAAYESILEGRPPEQEEKFAPWIMGDECGISPSSAVPETDSDRLRPNPERAARALAEHVVLMARAEALAQMDERNACVGLVQAWLRVQQAT
jgi:hypothetical protein